MKKIIFKSSAFITALLVTLCLSSGSAFSQIVFWTENFNNGCTYYCTTFSGTNGAWTFTQPGANGATPNHWFVSCTENGNSPGACGTGCGSNSSLHVGNDPNSAAGWLFCPTGDCGAAYDASSASEVSDIRAASPTISCVGKSTITANFAYIGKGQTNKDYCVFEYSANNGATWSAITAGLTTVNTGCAGQGKWTNVASVILPASANNNPTVKVAFHWINNGDGVGSDPSFAANDLTLSYSVTLPVEWLSFDASSLNKKVELKWITASEVNNSHFDIERSDDAEKFFVIGSAKGSGTSAETHSYSFTDNNPHNGINYYRLRQVDVDGKYNYSSVISAKCFCNDAIDFIFSQHDNSEKCMISFLSTANSHAQIILNNILGEEINSWNVNTHDGVNTLEINTANFSHGIYFIRLLLNEKSVAKKIPF